MQRILLLGLAILLLSAGTSSADRGVALDLGKVEIAEALTPGGSYHLPPVGVRNPGDEVTKYRMVVSSGVGHSGTPLPAGWIDFSPRELTLQPGQTKSVETRLSLPTGADPDDYEGLLAAQIVTEGRGAQVGAAAATKLTFQVESATLLGAWWNRLSMWFSDNGPWTWIVPAILVSSLIARQFRRHFAFRLERRV
jgi:hypothetical protein